VGNSENIPVRHFREGDDVNAPGASPHNHTWDNGNQMSFFAAKYKWFEAACLCNVVAVIVCITVSISLPWFVDNRHTLYAWSSGYIGFFAVPVVLHVAAALSLLTKEVVSRRLCAFFGFVFMGLAFTACVETAVVSYPDSYMFEIENSATSTGFHFLAGWYVGIAAVGLSIAGMPLYFFTTLYVRHSRPVLENSNNNTANLEIIVDSSIELQTTDEENYRFKVKLIQKTE